MHVPISVDCGSIDCSVGALLDTRTAVIVSVCPHAINKVSELAWRHSAIGCLILVAEERSGIGREISFRLTLYPSRARGECGIENRRCIFVVNVLVFRFTVRSSVSPGSCYLLFALRSLFFIGPLPIQKPHKGFSDPPSVHSASLAAVKGHELTSKPLQLRQRKWCSWEFDGCFGVWNQDAATELTSMVG